MSVVTGRDRDCPACRAVSGAGLLGIASYMANLAAKNPTTLGKGTLLSVAVSFSVLGMCRICDWPPFKKETS